MLKQLFAWRHGKMLQRLDHLPGPTPSLPFGTALAFAGRRKPWDVCADYAREYGGSALIWIGGRPAVVLNDPQLIGHVLTDLSGDFYKDAPCQALEPVITRGSLFITNPPQWQAARAENPLTSLEMDPWLDDQIQPMRQVLSAQLKRLADASNSGSIDLYWEMQRLAFQLFGQAFWGRTFDEDHFQWFRTLARTGDRRMKLPLPLPPCSPRFYSHRRKWYDGFEQLVEQARQSEPDGRPDLLHTVLRQGTSLSNAGLAEALATNFFGGVFSASSTINTALYLLSSHPQEMAALQAAVREAADADGGLRLAALRGCRPLQFVLREAMRYYPAVPIYFRNTAVDREVALGGHQLPPNTQLFISNWWLHRHSPHWDQPEEFRPSRWDHGVAEQNPIGSDYFFPFGRGPRMCVGMPFAMAFMELTLAVLLLEADVDLPAGQPYQQSFFFGVMMPKGLRAKFRLR